MLTIMLVNPNISQHIEAECRIEFQDNNRGCSPFIWRHVINTNYSKWIFYRKLRESSFPSAVFCNDRCLNSIQYRRLWKSSNKEHKGLFSKFKDEDEGKILKVLLSSRALPI